MSAPEKLDPVFLNSRRETLFALITWLVFCIWVVGLCVSRGYDIDPAKLETTMGMPSWIFWGVGLPWLMANVVTIWFALKFMVDDPLEEPATDADSKPEAGNE
jgi:hypothetical protein